MPRPTQPVPLREALDRYLHQRGCALCAMVRSNHSEAFEATSDGDIGAYIRFGYRGRTISLFVNYTPPNEIAVDEDAIDDVLYDRMIEEIDQRVRLVDSGTVTGLITPRVQTQ